MGRGISRALLAVVLLVLATVAGTAPAIAADSGTESGRTDVATATTDAATAFSGDPTRATAFSGDPTRATAFGDEPTRAAAIGSGAASQTTAADDSTVELTQRLRLVPEQKGVYEIGHRYRLPDQLRRLEVTIPEDSTVVSTSGFSRDEGRTYEWDGATDEPRIDYRLPGNRTVDQTGPIGAAGRLTFVDVGEWALVAPPAGSHSWGWVGDGDVGFQRSMETSEGATGNRIAYLGPSTEYTHTAHGQRFRLIVPASASLEESPEDLFASLSDASDRLRVGDRDEEVFLVAAPTPDGIEWGVRGLHTGGSDVWVRDFERLNEADNVWLHEYVHTRQGYASTADARWFTEGSAVYYAALLALEQERIGYDAFRDRLRAGERDYDGSILAEPQTWQGNANYHAGSLVAGDLDRRIRLDSDGETSLQAVFRRMNGKDGTVSAADLQSYLAAVGGEDVAAAGKRYTETTARPETWSAEQHREAFGEGSVPTEITYVLAADGDAVRVGGAYRNRSLDPGEPIVVVPGERLAFDVVATNHGGVGDYEATFRVDDEPVSTQSGRLDPDESTRLTFEHTFERTGRHAVSIGTETVRIEVREPASARVTDLSVKRSELTAGGSVRLAATVRNDARHPGELRLSFTRDGQSIATRRVRLDVGATRTVSTTVRFENPGTYVLGLGNASAETAVVTVIEEETPTLTATGTPGFGVAVAVTAVLLATASLAVSLTSRRREP
jgi:PGF-CTERM protein